MPISAAFSTCGTVPPSASHSAAPPSSTRHRLRPGSRLPARDGGIEFVENADRARGEQEAHDPIVDPYRLERGRSSAIRPG